MVEPLAPQAMYPAGVTGVSTRILTLSTGVRVRVAESGSPGGTPVVLLHGWAATIYTFRDALERLPAQGFRVIAPDLRGFGLSDKPITPNAYSLDAYLEDLRALLDALELDRVVLGGQSMGGGVSLHYALRNPEKVSRLVLINPTGLAPVGFVSGMRLVPQPFVSAFGPTLAPRFLIRIILKWIAYGDASLVTEQTIDEYWAPTQQPGFVRAGRAALSDFAWNPLPADDLQSMTVPAVVILGLQDRLIRNAANAAHIIPGGRVYTLRGGHCVHEEHPAEVYPLIAEFLQRTGDDGVSPPGP
jgi:pimeloyl-ACP methyl ester carboxylesterase